MPVQAQRLLAFGSDRFGGAAHPWMTGHREGNPTPVTDRTLLPIFSTSWINPHKSSAKSRRPASTTTLPSTITVSTESPVPE